MANNNGELTYFIKCHSFVKIGKTTGLKTRLLDLQVGNPYELELIGVTFHPEPELQYKFAHLQERNEWYHLTVELKDYIEKHAARPGQPEQNIERPTWEDIPIGKSSKQHYIRGIYDIIRELEREAGSAPLEKIIERGGKLGYSKDKVEAEITHLVREARIFEPRRYSGSYQVTQGT